MSTDARDRIVQAAMELFAAHGYAETSVEDIATAAQVSRSTFFRYFGSKESVVFPDHDEMLADIRRRLDASTQRSALDAVSAAITTVLVHYVSEGEHARRRYRLTSSIQALREREIAMVARYQRLFRQYLTRYDVTSDGSPLRAELMAAAVVSAHNHVLRRWLRGECDEPMIEIDQALQLVAEVFVVQGGGPQAVLVLEAGRSLADVLPALRVAVQG